MYYMKRKVLTFSVPPEVQDKLARTIKQRHQSRSEFLRSLIENQQSSAPTSEDLAALLSSYWKLRSESGLKVIMVGLAILKRPDGKILIGQLKDPDPYANNLSWSFPSGHLESLDFERDMRTGIKQRTGIDAKVENIIAARIFPDVTLSQTQIVALYFAASSSQLKVAPADQYYAKLKWVRPMEVFKHFTSSTSDEVTRYLSMLENSI